MTRTLIRLALLVLLLMAVGVVLARARGQAQPVAATTILGRGGCVLPCLLGVLPGIDPDATLMQLARAGAEDIRPAAGGLSPMQAISFVVRDALGQGAIGLVTLDGETGARVEAIRVSPLDIQANIATLSELLLSPQAQTLGPPRVFRTCGGVLPRRLQFVFGQPTALIAELYVTAHSVGEPLRPGMPLLSLASARPGALTVQDIQASFGCQVETGWHGFAALWRYFGPDR